MKDEQIVRRLRAEAVEAIARQKARLDRLRLWRAYLKAGDGPAPQAIADAWLNRARLPFGWLAWPHVDGPWQGPTTEEWVQRINDGAQRVAIEMRGAPTSPGRWTVPWYKPVDRYEGWSESEKRFVNGDR